MQLSQLSLKISKISVNIFTRGVNKYCNYEKESWYVMYNH